jgi:hypothetical protein
LLSFKPVCLCSQCPSIPSAPGTCMYPRLTIRPLSNRSVLLIFGLVDPLSSNNLSSFRFYFRTQFLSKFIASLPLACNHFSASGPLTASQKPLGSPCSVMSSVLNTKCTYLVFSLPSTSVSITVARSMLGILVGFHSVSNFLISLSSILAL